MGNKNIDNFLKEELNKTYLSPNHINNNLIYNFKKSEDFKIINLIFFIISLIQSLAIAMIGFIFLSNIFLKFIIIYLGVLLFNFTLSIYTVTIKKEGAFI